MYPEKPTRELKQLIFQSNTPFQLESGESLAQLEIAYTTHGVLSPKCDNVVWVFHALTANANPFEWWPGLVGEACLIDPRKYFIVCANIIASCYGSTGAESIDPKTQKPYGLGFPEITILDIVNAHKLLQNELNIDKIYLGIGGSMGGQQLLQWAVEDGNLFDNICLLATNARHSAWGIAFNTTQRMAMEADPTLKSNHKDAGAKGLEAARAIALLSYRNQKTYNKTQTDKEPISNNFKASSYQYYQGKKLSDRFNAHSYYALCKAMDSHNIGRGKLSLDDALKSIKSRALVLGIDSDLLFPFEEQEYIAGHIKDAQLKEINSFYGHDGFLIEVEQISNYLGGFLRETT